MKLLGKYVNGNYNVLIFDDGTKIRENDLDSLIPDKPESMDLKITNSCDLMCKFCHENSTPDGLHADILNMKFLDTLLPFTELAIGGGNPLSHPDLIPFLHLCKERKLIPNMTVNQYHFLKSQELIKKLVDEKLIYGLGVSLTTPTDKFIELIKNYPNAVIHIINGVQPISDIKKLYDNDLKLLILGYKLFRRGKDYYGDAVESCKKEFYDELPELIKHFTVVSFDNLALTQLECKRLLSDNDWNKYYMGDDGEFTMFIDAVNKTFSRSSTSVERFPLEDDIKIMFDKIRIISDDWIIIDAENIKKQID